MFRPIAVLLLLASSPGIVSAEDPLLTPTSVGDVSYEGCFTPDGAHFVFPLLPEKGTDSLQLQALEVKTGAIRSLGTVSIRGGDSQAHRGAEAWAGVVAASSDLGTVFLNQEVLLRENGRYHVWSSSKKGLIPLDVDLAGGTYLGGSSDGRHLAFLPTRSSPRIAVYDVENRNFSLSADREEVGKYDFLGAQFAWVGDSFLAFLASRGTANVDGARSIRVVTIWPEWKQHGEVPAITRTLRRGTGVVEPVPCPPILVARAAGEIGTWIFFRGVQVIAASMEGLASPVERFSLPLEDEPTKESLPIAVDTAEDVSYGGWFEPTANPPADFDGYRPADEVLGVRRTMVLKIVSRSTRTESAATTLEFDVSPLMENLCARALQDYRGSGAPKSDSGVLARTPDAVALCARNGKLFVILRFVVWYGIAGMTYQWPLLVDTRAKTLRRSAEAFGLGGSGIRSGPPRFSLHASPKGDAIVALDGTRLLLFRSDAP